MNEDFKVRVGQFEGPIDLLLDLIEKRKLHISDVSLSQVADEFIEYTKSFDEQKDDYVSNLADFILVASTLLLIKSKSLLPNLILTEEEQGSIEELERRLTDYKKYKELAAGLGKIFGNFSYFAEERKIKNIVFSPVLDINLTLLKNILFEVLKNIPPQITDLPKVAVAKIVSLEEMIEQLSERIKISLKTSFSDFARDSTDKRVFSRTGKAEKTNIIVSFLAMLELVKRGLIRVCQNKHFEDIQIESEKASVPKYL